MSQSRVVTAFQSAYKKAVVIAEMITTRAMSLTTITISQVNSDMSKTRPISRATKKGKRKARKVPKPKKGEKKIHASADPREPCISQTIVHGSFVTHT